MNPYIFLQCKKVGWGEWKDLILGHPPLVILACIHALSSDLNLGEWEEGLWTLHPIRGQLVISVTI